MPSSFSWFKANGHKRRKQTRTKLHFQKLEDRQMLAAVTFDAGLVTVIGSAADDVIRLDSSADFQSFTVRVNLNPSLTHTFNRADVSQVVVFAGDGNDIVINSLLNETRIAGQGGDDSLQGGFGDDFIFGGDGDDIISGRNGNDFISGQGDNDIIRGNSGDDTIFGLVGVDVIYGGEGNDTINGGGGADILDGGLGNDLISGGSNDDSIFGREGDDVLRGDNGNDFLLGGLGNDRLVGSDGNDRLSGTEGDDLIIAGAGDDTVGGGQGNDSIFGVSGTNELNGNGGDDNIVGGSGADAIAGGSGDDRLIGNAGNDRITGSFGIDVLVGGEGNDFVAGGLGNDLIFGNQGNDIAFGGGGNDRIDGGEGIDNSLHLFNQFEHRIAEVGENFQIFDFRIADDSLVRFVSGRDLLIDVENVQFGSGSDSDIFAVEDLVFTPPVERITVQPIVVSNDDGSNQAEFLGTPEQQREVLARLDQIFEQAGVDVNLLSAVSWHNTLANIGTVTDFTDRPDSDLAQIISAGENAGVTSSNPNVINLFFVDDAPGMRISGIAPLSAAVANGNGIVLQAANPDFFTGRENTAEAIAQSIARNMGLEFTVDTDNLLNPLIVNPGLEENRLQPFLTSSQTQQIIDSNFSRPI